MNGQYVAIESTAIGGEGMGGRSSGIEALQIGEQNLQKFSQGMQSGDGRYMIIDIREAIKNGAVAMELKDDQFLRQKIDEIAQMFDANTVPTDAQLQQVNNDNTQNNYQTDDGGGNNQDNNTGTLPSGYKQFNGAVSFGYPGSWTVTPRQADWPLQQLTHVISNAAGNTSIEVYNFSGYSNAQQVMSALQQYISQNGGSLQYQNAGQSQGFTVYTGTTTLSGGSLNWVAAFKSAGNGIAGIALGAVNGINYQTTAQKVFGTLR
jgi:hypothetical protein